MRRLLLFFFHHLYHRLAGAYDLISWLVSLGGWREWVRSVIPLLPPGAILELGFGPGHLQLDLHALGRRVTGLDESMPMNRQAHRRLVFAGFSPALARGLAQALPFANGSFDCVVATFPAPFIFSPQTAAEVARVLRPGGCLVALLAFRPALTRPGARLVRALFALTGQLPRRDLDTVPIGGSYREAGFQVETTWRRTADRRITLAGEMLVIKAVKPLE